jgi:hypothetical protein
MQNLQMAVSRQPPETFSKEFLLLITESREPRADTKLET